MPLSVGAEPVSPLAQLSTSSFLPKTCLSGSMTGNSFLVPRLPVLSLLFSVLASAQGATLLLHWGVGEAWEVAAAGAVG